MPQQNLYLKHRCKLRTGDILLFGRTKGLFSRIISWWTKSPITHVGMVYRIDGEDIICILHSDRSSGSTDMMTGQESTKGVQLNILSEVIREHRGKVWVRTISKVLPPSKRDKLIEFRKKMKGVKYEDLTAWKSLKELLLAGLGLSQRAALKRLFCSELLAYAYQFLDILLPERHANSYAPHHFVEDSFLLLNPETGYSFDKMKLIKA